MPFMIFPYDLLLIKNDAYTISPSITVTDQQLNRVIFNIFKYERIQKIYELTAIPIVLENMYPLSVNVEKIRYDTGKNNKPTTTKTNHHFITYTKSSFSIRIQNMAVNGNNKYGNTFLKKSVLFIHRPPVIRAIPIDPVSFIHISKIHISQISTIPLLYQYNEKYSSLTGLCLHYSFPTVIIFSTGNNII